MAIKLVLISVFMIMSGCASNTKIKDQGNTHIQQTIAPSIAKPPRIWSGHKEVGMSEKVCANKGKDILSSLGFSNIVKSPYGEYIYGVYLDTRTAVKCISVKEQTLVLVIVSGPSDSQAEKFRNKIMWAY